MTSVVEKVSVGDGVCKAIFDPARRGLLECVPRHTLSIPDTEHGPAAISVRLGLLAVAVNDHDISVFALPKGIETFAHIRTIKVFASCISDLVFFKDDVGHVDDVDDDASPSTSTSTPLLLVAFKTSPAVYALDITKCDGKMSAGSFSILDAALEVSRRYWFRPTPLRLFTKGNMVSVLATDSRMYLYTKLSQSFPIWEHVRTMEPPQLSCGNRMKVDCMSFAQEPDEFIVTGACSYVAVACHSHPVAGDKEVIKYQYQNRYGELRPVNLITWGVRRDVHSVSSVVRGTKQLLLLLTHSGGGGFFTEGCVQYTTCGKVRVLARHLRDPWCAQYVRGLGVVVKDANRVQVFVTCDQRLMDAMSVHRVAWMAAVAVACAGAGARTKFF